MADYDAIFIGSGHNALTGALCLADAGWRVLVLEQSIEIGGALRTEELTLPGFKHDLYATNVGRFAVSPIYQQFRAEFEGLGIRFLTNENPFASAYTPSSAARAYVDVGAMEAELAARSHDDVEGWRSARSLFDRLSSHLLALNFSMMPSANALRRVARIAASPNDAARLLRILLQSPRRFVESFFRSKEIQGLILPWSFHSDFGPDIRGGAIFAFVTGMSAQQRGIGISVGGAGSITRGLQAMIERRGGEIRRRTEVVRIHVRQGAAVAVQSRNGEQISASRAIVAGVTPRNLFGRLVSEDDLPTGFMRRIRRFRYGIGTFIVHLALTDRLAWTAAEDLADFNTIHIGGTSEDLARTYEQCLSGYIPDRPLLVVSQTTPSDPSRAPPGRHVVRIHSRAFPGEIRGDSAGRITARDWQGAREFVADRLIDQLAEHAPNVREAMLARHVVSPLDLEQDNPNFVGGDCASGSQHLSQNYMFRPLLGWSRYRTPVANLFIAGSSTWPGSGIHGASGYLLAQQLLRQSSAPA